MQSAYLSALYTTALTVLTEQLHGSAFNFAWNAKQRKKCKRLTPLTATPHATPEDYVLCL